MGYMIYKDICWTDHFMPYEFYQKMKPHQIINVFPGVEEICRKNLLIKHLNIMKKRFPYYYNYFPKSWILPQDYNEFK